MSGWHNRRFFIAVPFQKRSSKSFKISLTLTLTQNATSYFLTQRKQKSWQKKSIVFSVVCSFGAWPSTLYHPDACVSLIFFKTSTTLLYCNMCPASGPITWYILALTLLALLWTGHGICLPDQLLLRPMHVCMIIPFLTLGEDKCFSTSIFSIIESTLSNTLMTTRSTS